MGYTILLQWNVPSPPAPLGNLIVNRLLEHYNLNQLVRSTVHFRTYKSTNIASSPTNALTTITYTLALPSNPSSTQGPAHAARDDTTYLFLQERTLTTNKSTNGWANATANAGSNGTKESAIDLTGEDGQNGDENTRKDEEHKKDESDGPTDKFRIMALRPAASVLPLLQSLQSPFVMGLTKSARAAASTTASAPVPTVLPGQAFALSTFTYLPTPAPLPPITLSIHNLPSPTAPTVLLEAELGETSDSSGNPTPRDEAMLKELLEGCLPMGLEGSVQYLPIVDEAEASEGKDNEGVWDGVERTKRVTMALAKALRGMGAI